MPSPKHHADVILLLTIFGLTLFGLIMVASASAVIADRFRSDVFYYVKHQLLFGATVGLGTFFIGYFIPYYRWRALALPAMIVSIILLVLVFVPGLKVEYGGAARWVGFGPITIQPTEIAKIAVIVYLAALLERKGDEVRNWRKTVAPFLIITSIIAILIMLQPDIGTLFTIVATAGAMVFVAGFRLRHLALIVMGGLAIFALLINTASYRLSRIMTYLHPELDPKGIGYQINQALLAVSTGGVWGLGFGRSRQKYHYLPEPAGDSIFAIIGEELGLIRTLFILAGFMLIGWRGLSIARKAPDVFGRLLATGITSWILTQAFVNMGSILAVTPLTGIPLPFISYGGTALATVLFASGVLLNISKYTL